MRFTCINRKKTHVFPLLLDNRVTTGHSESLGQLIRFPSVPWGQTQAAVRQLRVLGPLRAGARGGARVLAGFP